MNKDLDERLVENGQYINALNIQTGELSGTNQTPNNIKGNTKLSSLAFIDGTPLSQDAITIGAYTDIQKQTIYWFVHDPNATAQPLGKIDMIVSLNTITDVLTYHVISVYNPNAPTTTTLNFNPTYLINAVNLIDGMLFFTDDYNQPKYINITRSYPYPILGVDDSLLDEMLNVVKKPPFSAPTLQLINSVGDNKYLDNRFLCFAYRYRYDDNMYSATSQWSEPAFIPQQFLFNSSSTLNDGMTNAINDVILNINTGGLLVKGIDILFKEADGNIIKVSEKIDKGKLGLPSNSNYSYNFDEKVFTGLPDSELLRRYDNVPLKAKAQTIMGNRLMYGNYTEGYPLVSADNQPVLLDYQCNLNSSQINNFNVDNRAISVALNSISAPYPKNSLYMDFTGIPLQEGGLLTISLSFTHFSFSGATPAPTEKTNNITVNFNFIIPSGVTNVSSLASNINFINAIGTATNILPVYGVPPTKTSCEGITFTDIFCCAFPYRLNDKVKYDSFLSTSLGVTKNIQITNTFSTIILTFPAIEYRNLQTNSFNYEYTTITYSNVLYRSKASPKSLHSDRNYSVDIVYMDEYKRESTPLASTNNLVNVPCLYSTNQNKIEVTIPITQKAPYWAKSYKFVLKPSADRYETIYSNLYFVDPLTRETYYLLEGDNINKVEVGDRFTVKSDMSGVNTQCSNITVLSKEAYPENFINIPNYRIVGENVTIPSGVYMKVNQTNNTVLYDQNYLVAFGEVKNETAIINQYPQIIYPIGFLNPTTGQWEDATIPAGSKIKLTFSFKRSGELSTALNRVEYTLSETLISSKSYNNFKEWWDGDNVAFILNSGKDITGAEEFAPTNSYIQNYASSPSITPIDTINQYQFYRYPISSLILPNALVLVVRSGIEAIPGGIGVSNKSLLLTNIEIYRNSNTFIFETQPAEAVPIFYENDKCFGINSLGEHLGNIQNQNFSTSTPAIVDTGFFNCFAFGNGAESYKYNDSLIGRFFTLGNRSVSESNQDFSQIRRFADMTYSGVLNEETNVNKLNEFNLGLLNFKPLEKSFGPIYVLDGRQNDILVLQENRISYVLANKNLISDSAGGGAISSVPEILGTQISRIEEYGISNHPESYIQFGFDRFFVDSKRGAVLHLKGESYSADNLEIISDLGMKAYFRDNLTLNSNNQILGSYDPFLGNYIIGMNNRELPSVTGCLDCGIQSEYVLTNNQPITFCVNQQNIVGDVIVSWIPNIDTPPAFTISATYNSNNYTSGIVTSSGNFTIPKDVITENTVVITAVINDLPPISLPISISVSCVNPQELTVIDVVLTSSAEVGNTTHTESRYFAGIYTSPVRQESVLFASGINNPLVSLYTSYTGNQGTGWFPTDGSTVRMATRKLQSDSFDFDQVDDSFKYLRSNTLYSNNSVDIATLLSLATTVIPNQGGGNYNYGEFTNPTGGNYLYLIYDLRNSFSVPLCYSNVDEESVCCACYTCSVPCKTYFISNGAGTLSYIDCNTNIEVLMGVEPGTSYYVCATDDSIPFVYDGFFNIVEINSCSCVPCNGDCIEFLIGITSPTATLNYSDCGGNITSISLTAGVHNICMSSLIAPYITDGTGTIDFNNCICL